MTTNPPQATSWYTLALARIAKYGWRLREARNLRLIFENKALGTERTIMLPSYWDREDDMGKADILTIQWFGKPHKTDSERCKLCDDPVDPEDTEAGYCYECAAEMVDFARLLSARPT